MALRTRPLGRTGVAVTELGYGAMELRGQPRGPAVRDEDAERILNAVLDGGINIIDTSIDYGRSEELIGRYLSDRRDEYFLASKCGCPLSSPPGGPVPAPHDFGAGNVRAGVEQSLRRLRTDRLDLVQVHMSPSRAQLEADHTIGTLRDLRDEGKVRFIGMSGTLPNLPDHLSMGVFDVFQVPYSVVQRDHEDLITQAAEQGAGVLVRGGAARGAPGEGKGWERGPLGMAEGVARARWELAAGDDLLDGMSPMEFVIRFTLSHPKMSTTIVGTANPDHLASNLAVASEGPLPSEVYERAKERFPGPGDGVGA